MISNKGGTVAGIARYIPYGETEPFFNTWEPVGPYNRVEQVLQLSKIAKILDDTAIEKYAESKAALADKQKLNEKFANAVGNLLDTFGV